MIIIARMTGGKDQELNCECTPWTAAPPPCQGAKLKWHYWTS